MLADYDAEGVAEIMGISPVPVRSGFHEDRVAFVTGSPDDGLVPGDTESEMSPLLIERAVEQGLPRHVLRHLAERLAGGDRNRVTALEWAIVPKTTLERRNTKLSPAESERTERVARLFVHARRALGSEDEARTFMVAPHPELDGRSPLDATRTDLATRRAEHVLGALEYGLAI